MDEFSINRLASMLDVDRATLLRALKDTPADAGSEPKPLFRVSRAVKARIITEASWTAAASRIMAVALSLLTSNGCSSCSSDSTTFTVRSRARKQSRSGDG
jgi:hypothetical protein